MWPFSANKRRAEMQRFILRTLNNNSRLKDALYEGPRAESRTDLAMIVLVIPAAGKRLRLGEAFATVTKDFTSDGLSILVPQRMEEGELVVGFAGESGPTFVHAQIRHQEPREGGFFHVGMQLTGLVDDRHYRELKGLTPFARLAPLVSDRVLHQPEPEPDATVVS